MCKVIDLAGQKYGRLYVTNLAYTKDWKAYWNCVCDCGNKCIKLGSNLKNGHTSSCGCLSKEKLHNKADNLQGKNFGLLTAINRTTIQISNRSKVAWECLCECGNTITVPADNLRSGNTKSCGCTRISSTSLIGTKINKWSVFNVFQNKATCKCECGVVSDVYISHLLDGSSKSCGRCTEKSYEILTCKTFGFLYVESENIEKYSIKVHRWNCKCLLCGAKTIVSTTALKTGKTLSCGCLKSRGEKAISEYLVSNNIKFKKEYIYKDLKSKKDGYLRFDFAIIDDAEVVKFLIEYQGEQHYRNIFNLPSEEWEECCERDKLKKQYCMQKNIPLYEIRYDENLIERLMKIFNEN